MKTIYCLGDYQTCARYMVTEALCREAVPEDMFPIQKERAEEIITADR
ncbi:MAG: hypothetical protein RRA32_07690 [bacterium]|nr:hypothetical protein [bacterium]